MNPNYSDAHTHLDERMKHILQRTEICTVISCSSPRQCEEAEKMICDQASLHMSCGIHPWHVDQTSFEEMLPWLQKTKVIGEIGMDNVWCKTDLQLQEQIFVRQLQFACKNKKPVVLHTKGMEQEILEQIRRYPNTYHVHWYSCAQYIEEYRDLGCYFSIGPFPSIDENVAKVAKIIPIDRLLIETDGISAVEWAEGKTISDGDYPRILQRIAAEIASIKELTTEEVLYRTKQNLLQFLTSERG